MLITFFMIWIYSYNFGKNSWFHFVSFSEIVFYSKPGGHENRYEILFGIFLKAVFNKRTPIMSCFWKHPEIVSSSQECIHLYLVWSFFWESQQRKQGASPHIQRPKNLKGSRSDHWTTCPGYVIEFIKHSLHVLRHYWPYAKASTRSLIKIGYMHISTLLLNSNI